MALSSSQFSSPAAPAPSPPRGESSPRISVVAPVFNEAECLTAFHARLQRALGEIGPRYEILYIDDGSDDASLELLRRFAEADGRVGYQSFSRNFGHEAATTCGLAAARGEAVVLIDTDLQDPPELIPELYARWRLGWQVVVAQRRDRAGETWLVRATSALFYRFLRRFCCGRQILDAGDFRLLDRRVVDAVNQLSEHHRYVRGLTHWVGFRQTSVPFDRAARAGGSGKYTLWKRASLALDAVFSLSLAPLRAVSWGGFFLAIASAAALSCLALAAAFGARLGVVAWLIASGGLFSGIQLLGMGVVCEYLARVHANTQGRPLYLIAEKRPATGSAAKPASAAG